MIVVVTTVITQREDKYLFVNEVKAEAAGKYGLPGGKLEAGETLEACARREFKEETGCDVDDLELIALVHKPYTQHGNTVVRFFYRGILREDSLTKAELKTTWLSLEEVETLSKENRIRGKDIYDVLKHPDEPGKLTIRTF